MSAARARGVRSLSLVSAGGGGDASRVFVSEAAAAGVEVRRVLELGPLPPQASRGSGDEEDMAAQVKIIISTIGLYPLKLLPLLQDILCCCCWCYCWSFCVDD